MNLPQEATLLRIFVGENGRFEHRPLHEAIVLKAREVGLAGRRRNSLQLEMRGRGGGPRKAGQSTW